MYDIPILSMLGILSALIAIHFIMVWSAHIRLELGDPARPGMQVQPLLPSPRTLIGSRSRCPASFAADNLGGIAPTACRRSGRDAARGGCSLPARFQCLAPPHQMVKHHFPALHQVIVIIQGATALDDPKIWLHRDVHFVPDRRHLQFDDHAAQGLDRARRADAAVANKGDGLALPLQVRTVESVLENRRGTVIVLGDRCNKGIELADTIAPSFRLRLDVNAASVDRRRWLVEERQFIVTQVQYCKPQIGPRCRTLDQPSYRRVGESVRPGASDNQSHVQHVSSSTAYVGSCGKHASASTASPKKLGVLSVQKNPYKIESSFQGIRNAEPSRTECRSASGAASRRRSGKL